MDAVYFFCESGTVRVPFPEYNRPLFYEFIASGGIWNNPKREFVFGNAAVDERIAEKIRGVPCVWVESGARIPVRVHNLRERPWEDVPASAPDPFPEYWRAKLEAELRARKYSPRTLRAYLYYNRLLCGTLKKTPDKIQPEDITAFLARVEKDNNFSSASLNLAISAINFFYVNVLQKDEIGGRHRPRSDKTVPVILDKSEIAKILDAEKNPKHRLLLMLAYSSGLRVSEVVTLKREHIDTVRKVICVKQGKGRKDRYTLLSEKAARFLAAYLSCHDIDLWLFPGQPLTKHLSIRSAQYIFDKAVCRAGILKDVSIHSLRHSFATHLLESGTDIKYIQTLLGHATLRTTERYTHVARRSVLSIQSPLDTIQ